MNWGREFNLNDYIYLVIFLVIYTIYFLRLRYIARKLKTSSNASLIKFILRGIYLGLLSLGLLGPSFGVTEKEAMAVGKEIYLSFDLSSSMNANDLEPSRLDKGKNDILALVDKFEFNKIGLIIFNTAADIYAPLTFDHERIKSLILNLKTSMLPMGSTNYNMVLKLIVEKFKNKSGLKIAILVTDGESHETIDESILKEIKNNNIRLIFLGIGNTAGSKIPIFNGFKKDAAGIDVITKLDIENIANICNQTNGAYFIISPTQNEVSKLKTYISELKDSGKNSYTAITYNKYIYFLIPAFLLIIFDFLVTVNVLKL
jgi:Ca-activated chloride channel homolog